MFQYFLPFLLINSYYLSLGNPIKGPLISESLNNLASQCENSFLAAAINDKIKDCAVSGLKTGLYTKRQIRCLIFYDINKQLCAAVAAAKIAVSTDVRAKIVEKQDVNTVCTQAKDWLFSNISEYTEYKNSSEELFKSPATCGEICGVEETMNEANDYCKYYKFGLELLRAQMSTTADNVNVNAVDAPDIPDESNAKADIPVSINNQASPQTGNTNTQNVQIKQTESSTVMKTHLEKTNEPGVVPVVKSTPQASEVAKQPSSEVNVQTNVEKEKEGEVLEHPIDTDGDYSNKQANKSAATNQAKTDLENDPPGLPEVGNVDSKKVILENTDAKAPPNLPDEYADSDGNDQGDDEDDMDMKSGPEVKQDSVIKTKLNVQHQDDLVQKEVFNPYPMTSDNFTDDGDHFLPFFLTAVIMVVLLYVLYHNKSKVGKVFFGLILEGRQSSRRRNSRGHAYRRLDTLEQAMSANTAAPPSKIIY